MISFPNAKINIGLNVVSKRADGYHNLETIFYPVKLADILEIVDSDKPELSISGIQIEGPLSENLILRAYRLLKNDFDLPPVKFHLHKIIPFGAGLGGGSS
ncbi:MAG: 4-(cytidine 5'-diphospho)-2-C-methyl-D-erythritol kinase, partial [Prolixibacteraceae bacterium]|nr:4-(cytidine 5'-diphospho)-2-C-methyl-D-erythritol kinase [Prolixibacteraceae bacterium]